MTAYTVTTYDDKATYTVTLDESGVTDVDGLFPATAKALKSSVARHMERHSLSPVAALGLAVGRYSHLTEVKEDPSVTDPA